MSGRLAGLYEVGAGRDVGRPGELGVVAGDEHAVGAVLAAAGHATPKRPQGPAGLTQREVEVLELVALHDGESELRGYIRFLVDDGGTSRFEELMVRLTTRRAFPIAEIDFNGSPVPRRFDLGNGSRPYKLAVANHSSVPLVVRFADLPPWLTFEVNGRSRKGPLPGLFFERSAPFAVQLRAHAGGKHDGVVRIETNDPRPQFHAIALRLSACIEPVRVEAPAVAPA